MTDSNTRPLPKGARIFPGVDLALWFNLVVLALLTAALITGAAVVAFR